MEVYDEAFVRRFLAPWNAHDADGAVALMTDDCVWEITRGSEPHGTLADGSQAKFHACDVRDGKISAKRSYRKVVE